MEKVTGIAGIFIKSKNPKLLAQWYKEHLGVEVDDNYSTLNRNEEKIYTAGPAILSFFKHDSDYFNPSQSNVMLNFKVKDLNKIMAQLNSAGCWIAEHLHYYEHGSFGWTMDPEGNKIELWEPKSQQ